MEHAVGCKTKAERERHLQAIEAAGEIAAHLSAEVERFKAENEALRARVTELEARLEKYAGRDTGGPGSAGWEDY